MAELKIVVSYLDRIISQLNGQDIVSGNLNTRMRYLEQWAMNSSSGAAFAPSVTSTDGTEPDVVVEGDQYDKNDDIDDEDGSPK
jgi:hypothetical protein